MGRQFIVNMPTGRAGLRTVLRQTWLRSRRSISNLIVVACVVLFVLLVLLDLFGVASTRQSVSFLGLSYVGVFRRIWLHQFLTAPFVHDGLAPLAFNMLSLWMLGPTVERRLGRGRYLLFTLLCAGSSMVGFLIFSWGSAAVMFGYSGVIFGILVAQAVLYPDNLLVIFALFPLKMKHAAFLLGGIELYLTVAPQRDWLVHVAHLFGAVAALVYFKGPAILRSVRARIKV